MTKHLLFSSPPQQNAQEKTPSCPCEKNDPCRKFNAGESFQPLRNWVVATQIFFYFHPYLGRFPFWRFFFSKGLKPPTRKSPASSPPMVLPTNAAGGLSRCRGGFRGPLEPVPNGRGFLPHFGWRDSDDFWQAFYLRWWYHYIGYAYKKYIRYINNMYLYIYVYAIYSICQNIYWICWTRVIIFHFFRDILL